MRGGVGGNDAKEGKEGEMMNTTMTWAKLPHVKQTKKQRIAHLEGVLDLLEREIVVLRERVAALEARPYVIWANDDFSCAPPIATASGTYPDPRHTESAKGSGK
jgi:hypothetical protein